ncbi:hypothetical protein [Enorma phocaeensis]|uniref:hypothetical protein n=1 Tax=Enorma phocaeensis TaxID=1871019 RepID=UPI00320A5185
MPIELLALCSWLLRTATDASQVAVVMLARPARRPRLLAAICVGAVLASWFERGVLGAAVASPVWWLALYIAPLLLWSGRFAFRAILLGADLLCMAFAEALGALFWLVATGTPIGSYETASMYPLVDCILRVLVLALCFAKIPVLRRIGGALDASNMSDALLMPLVVLIFAQMIGLMVFYYASLEALTANPLYLGGSVVGSALSAAADYLLLVSVARASDARRDRARAKELAGTVEARIAEERAALEDAAAAARLRHDARNHLQVLVSLVERDGLGAACVYARGVADSMDREGA